MLLVLYNKNVKSNLEIVYNNYKNLANNNIYIKRKKVFIPLDLGLVSNHNLPQLSSLMPGNNDSDTSKEKDNKMKKMISSVTKLTSSSRTTPESNYTSLTKFLLCSVDTNIEQD